MPLLLYSPPSVCLVSRELDSTAASVRTGAASVEPGSDTWKDRDRFKKFAKASLELCQVYVEIFSSTGSIKQLSTAEMHLKNVIRQAESFSDTDEFRDLEACYDEVKIKLQSN
ncbi:hypothetical protein VNO80_19284 [Phaseolus coccineus]|uniref:Uncharacterized protein n=1 Tax=Phaseolus coccineus TaxID=3886 RepID=A0AAN9MG57_PHACN